VCVCVGGGGEAVHFVYVALWITKSSVGSEVFSADIKTQFVLHRRHITSQLPSPVSYCYVRSENFTAVTRNCEEEGEVGSS
jgi:hypothetical protein